MDDPLAELVLHSDDDLLGMLSDDLVKPGAESGSPEICPWHSLPFSHHSADALTSFFYIFSLAFHILPGLQFPLSVVSLHSLCLLFMIFVTFLMIWFYLVGFL